MVFKGFRAVAARIGASIRTSRNAWLAGAAALISTAAFVALLWAQPLLAAVMFNYFNVISSPAGVVLEWSTASESSISGFDVLCKRSDEPDTQFHSIGYVPAKGTLSTGALYSFPVTALEPGVTYCFRLVELTSDGTAGEVLDQCGYGISITPTPQLIGVQPNLVPGATPAVTPTPGGAPPFDPFAATATAQALIFQQQGIDPFAATATAQALLFQQGIDPVAATATAQALLFQQGADPFAATATALALTAQPTFDVFGATATAQALMGYPTPTTPAQSFETPTAYPSPQVNTGDPSVASAMEPTPTFMPLAAAPTPPFDAGTPTPDAGAALAMAPDGPLMRSSNADNAENADTPGSAAAAVATPAYIVATATPTQETLIFGPGLTPLPTVTPTAGLAQWVNLVEPTSQNLLVMLLCMTFTGATGLGILGLITSVMFMRSRSSQREFYDRHSNRRRY